MKYPTLLYAGFMDANPTVLQCFSNALMHRGLHTEVHALKDQATYKQLASADCFDILEHTKQEVRDWIDRHPDQQVALFGHSLGGVFVLLAALQLQSEEKYKGKIALCGSYAIAARLRLWLFLLALLPGLTVWLLSLIPFLGRAFRYIPVPAPAAVRGKTLSWIPFGAVPMILCAQWELWRETKKWRKKELPFGCKLIYGNSRDVIVAPARGLLRRLKCKPQFVPYGHDVPIGNCVLLDSEVELGFHDFMENVSLALEEAA